MSWFAFEIEEYDTDTMHLSAAEDGIYNRLLRHYYKTRVPLPDDDRALAAIARITVSEWDAVKITIRAFFKLRKGHLIQRHCERELRKEDELSKRRSERAKRAINKRWAISKGRIPREYVENSQAIPNDTTRPDQTKKKGSDDKESSGGKPPNGHDQTDDPVKALFDAGVSILTGAGSAEKQARSLVGKWRKAMHDDGKLLAILLSAAEHHAIDPVAWIAKAVAEATQPGLWGNGSRAVI